MRASFRGIAILLSSLGLGETALAQATEARLDAERRDQARLSGAVGLQESAPPLGHAEVFRFGNDTIRLRQYPMLVSPETRSRIGISRDGVKAQIHPEYDQLYGLADQASRSLRDIHHHLHHGGVFAEVQPSINVARQAMGACKEAIRTRLPIPVVRQQYDLFRGEWERVFELLVPGAERDRRLNGLLNETDASSRAMEAVLLASTKALHDRAPAKAPAPPIEAPVPSWDEVDRVLRGFEAEVTAFWAKHSRMTGNSSEGLPDEAQRFLAAVRNLRQSITDRSGTDTIRADLASVRLEWERMQERFQEPQFSRALQMPRKQIEDGMARIDLAFPE